ncbi:hypothetical protein O181_117854 [Austropuccinia psidii MF-1]|uniref:Uncharacterized protein n=1 Tax=Austropuccinia psidii MF-1 TaxID=1389203 RepID=A0A9Q3KE43_9BASI|nr:hypothetical protein [Austropuccinia psidii MF-1]
MIQDLQDMIRKLCANGLKLEGSDDFTHYWCSLIPAFELAYKTSIYSSIGTTPAMLKKGWNPRLPQATLRKYFFDIHATASRFKVILDKVKNHPKERINNSFEYIKQNLGKIHKAKMTLPMTGALSHALLDRKTRVAWHSAIRELTWKTPQDKRKIK